MNFLPLLAKRLRRGGCASRECNATFERADGVVPRARRTTPSTPFRYRSFFFVARPLLLDRFARRSKSCGLLVAVWLLTSAAFAQAPAPPGNLTATDHPWDNGTRVDLTWTPSTDDAGLQGYIVRKKPADDAEFALVEIVPRGTSKYTVSDLNYETAYQFEVVSVTPNNTESATAATAMPITPTRQWFDGTRIYFLSLLVVFCAVVLGFIVAARSGRTMKVRPIPGLKAVDEAVGRATEMGRPILFIPGIQDMNDIQTIAGLNILARVAATAAEYDAKIELPMIRSLVMTAARETVQAAALSAGRPDAYNPESIYYVTDEQFAYVAYLQGLMSREKPAACFYLGHFFAESLILAEMGNSVGAIQIAGTAETTQLPFFVAACDYTLIGEEFFAASAYLSGEPDQLGSLKGQDVGKLLVAVAIIVGVAGATIVSITNSPVIQRFLDYFVGTMLT